MKKAYRLKNWSAYNNALIARGSTEFWIDDEVKRGWKARPRRVPGSPRIYSELAIETCVMIRKLFHLPLRALQGFLGSLVKGNMPVPNYTTVSRRGQCLNIHLKKTKKEKTIVVIDSTGVKVYGEGEWKVRQHGSSKRRTWRKIHVAIDEKGEIRATDMTGNETHDADAAKRLLGMEESSIQAFLGDGAYDQRKVYDVLRERGVTDIRIPPRRDAKIWVHGNKKDDPHPRDENLRAIRVHGRTSWKISSGYHLRSLVENTMFRFKTIFGERLSSRNFANQITEIKAMSQALNKMWRLGMPESYAVLS